MKATTALLWAACLGYSMVILDTTVRNVALPSIAAETGSAPVQQQWIVDSYVLVMTALLLAGGGLIDRFGASKVFRPGVVERRTSTPLLPTPILTARPLHLDVLAGLFMFVLFYGALFAANLYSQKVLGLSALESGLLLLPAGVPVFALPIIVSGFAGKKKSPAALTATGDIIATRGAALALLTAVSASPLVIPASLLGVGVGFGIASPLHLLLPLPSHPKAPAASPARWPMRDARPGTSSASPWSAWPALASWATSRRSGSPSPAESSPSVLSPRPRLWQ